MHLTTRCVLVIATVMLGSGSSLAYAANDCAFVVRGQTWWLLRNCQTDQTMSIPDGATLDGRNRSITAVDPPGGHFLGAVVRNAGATAHVRNLVVRTLALSNVCNAETPTDDRLRGILFEGASGSITNNRVVGIRQVAGNCQEGFGIDVRNASTNPPTQVQISRNRVADYQKAGIVVRGPIDASITNNRVIGSGVTTIAQNGIELTDGARGEITDNRVSDNEYTGLEAQATGILVGLAGDVQVSDNRVSACDAGIALALTDGALITDNRVSRAVRYGLLVQANESTLLDNRVWRSDGVGIYVSGEANTTEDNVVRNSLDFDIYNEGDNDYLDNRCDTSSGPPVDCGNPDGTP